MTTSVAKRVSVRPPEKGSFPLDHDGQCKLVVKEYLQCMRTSAGDHSACHDLSKRYLECRMEKSLMQHEDLDSLGFDEEALRAAKTGVDDANPWSEGYVAGANVKTSGFFARLFGLSKDDE